MVEPTITAYFLGEWPGGHGCSTRKPGGRMVYVADPPTPWFGTRAHETQRAEVMRTCWDRERDGQPEGEARFAREDGWTLICLWDRSEDHRGNSASVFAIHSDLTDEEALGLARRLFPQVFERIEARLQRDVRLAPATCPLCRQSLEEC